MFSKGVFTLPENVTIFDPNWFNFLPQWMALYPAIALFWIIPELMLANGHRLSGPEPTTFIRFMARCISYALVWPARLSIFAFLGVCGIVKRMLQPKIYACNHCKDTGWIHLSDGVNVVKCFKCLKGQP